MRPLKIVCSITCLLTLISLLSSCSGDQAKGDYLKIWAPSEEQEVLIDLGERFNEEFGYDIKFDFRVMSVAESINAIKQDPDTAADVFMYPSGGVSELTMAGLILPITLGADSIKEAHSEKAIKSVTKGEYIYGVPVTPNTFFMYYNKELFTEEEVKSLNVMMEKDLGPNKYNFAMNLADSWYASSFFFGLGNRLFGPDGDDPNHIDFNNSAGVKAATYMLSLAQNSKFLNDDGEAGNFMKQGNLGAYLSGTWSSSGLKEGLGENYAATALPSITIEGAEYQLRNFVDYKVYGVNVRTSLPQKAIEFATYLGSPNAQMFRYETYGEAPTVKELLNHPQIMANIEISALLAQEALAVSQPSIPKLADFWVPMSSFGAELVNGTINSTNLESKLNALVNAIRG